MSQSSSLISKRCKIMSGASRQSLMSQFMVCTHQHGHPHPQTDANLLTQQPQTLPQTSLGSGQTQSRMKERQFREEWKISFPWLVAGDWKCFYNMCWWMTEDKRWSPTDQPSAKFTVTGFIPGRKRCLEL